MAKLQYRGFAYKGARTGIARLALLTRSTIIGFAPSFIPSKRGKKITTQQRVTPEHRLEVCKFRNTFSPLIYPVWPSCHFDYVESRNGWGLVVK